MVKELDPEQARRVQAFRLWMKAPMPMLTFFKTLDVTRLVRLARHGFTFNALMCWCIGKAAGGIKEFYMLPVVDKLLGYDELAVSTVVALDDGDILWQYALYFRSVSSMARWSLCQYSSIISASSMVLLPLNVLSYIDKIPRQMLRPIRKFL